MPTALHQAASRGQLDAIEAVLRDGTPVDLRDADGSTALCAAAFAEQREAVALLLARGADPRARVTSGWFEHHSAVEFAMRRGAPDLVETLLRAGGAYEPDRGGPGRAIKHMNNVLTSLLLDRNSGGDAPKHFDGEAIADLARCLVGDEPEDANAPLVRIARVVGASASARDRDEARALLDAHHAYDAAWAVVAAEGFEGPRTFGAPPPTAFDRLENAVKRGDATTVAALLAKERSALRADGLFDRGHAARPLFEAIRGGHLDVVQALAKSRIDLGAWTHADGQAPPETALGLAVTLGRRAIARCLATAGARPDAKRRLRLRYADLEDDVDVRARSVLGACKDPGELAWLLDEMGNHGGKLESLLATLMLDAIAHDDAARVAFLLDRGVSPNEPLGNVPPLDVAHRLGAAAAAKVLADRGARAARFPSLVPRDDD